MKVSKEQIEELFVFTRKHYVEHYDLQLELVDHLAQGIEQQWETDPKLSFEDALKREFKKFGVFGFMEVVEKRQKAMSKRYNRIIWKHLKTWFRLPQIMMLVALTALFFVLFEITMLDQKLALGILITIFISYIIGAILEFRRKRKIKKQKKNDEDVKSWMFKDIIGGYGNSFGFFMLPYYIFQPFIISDFNPGSWHPALTLVVAFGLAVTVILYYIVFFEIPKMADKYLNEVYPEYRLVETA